MRLLIFDDVVLRYPDLRITYLVVRGIDNTGTGLFDVQRAREVEL